MGRRRFGAGEVVWQCGHGQGPKDEETSRHNEGGYVVARYVFQEPWKGVKKQKMFSATGRGSHRDACSVATREPSKRSAVWSPL